MKSNKLAALQITFPLNKDELIPVFTRKDGDLPREIRGRALWLEIKPRSRSHYDIKDNFGGYHAVEYINNHWYFIRWANNAWWTSKSDRVFEPKELGLRTSDSPYIESPDLKRLKLKHDPSEDSDEAEVDSENSDDPSELEEQKSLSLTFGIPIPIQEQLPSITEESTTPKQERMTTKTSTYAETLSAALAATTLEPSAENLRVPPLERPASPPPQPSKGKTPINFIIAGDRTLPPSGRSASPSRVLASASQGGNITGGTARTKSTLLASGSGTTTFSSTGSCMGGSGGTSSGGAQGSGTTGGGASGGATGGSGAQTGGGGPPGAGGGGNPPGGAPRAAGAQGQIPGVNGSMRGHPPEIFDGQRKNTAKFVKEFGLWKLCNMRNEGMANPFVWVALALSYISCVVLASRFSSLMCSETAHTVNSNGFRTQHLKRLG